MIAVLTFFSDLYATAADKTVRLRFAISGRGTPSADTRLNMQLWLKAGETIETGAGKKLVLGTERVELPPADLGGGIVHRGWTLEFPKNATLIWPVYPHNPYADVPETAIAYAVGRLTVPPGLEGTTREIRAGK